MSAAAAEAASLFMSKFEVEAGSGEVDVVFKSMDAECKVCMQETKERHQVAYSIFCTSTSPLYSY
jgi:hypothetical protein